MQFAPVTSPADASRGGHQRRYHSLVRRTEKCYRKRDAIRRTIPYHHFVIGRAPKYSAHGADVIPAGRRQTGTGALFTGGDAHHCSWRAAMRTNGSINRPFAGGCFINPASHLCTGIITFRTCRDSFRRIAFDPDHQKSALHAGDRFFSSEILPRYLFRRRSRLPRSTL